MPALQNCVCHFDSGDRLPIDREEALRRADRAVRQGRVEVAITGYLRVVADQPRDWATANALGDLYVRTRQIDQAVVQFRRIGDQLLAEGFLPKAAALYKKILKIAPNDERTHLQLADLSGRQGLFTNAKAHLTAVAAERRRRGDRAGADEMLRRIASVDPAEVEARAADARNRANDGDATGLADLKRLAGELKEQARHEQALELLREVRRLDPADAEVNAELAQTALRSVPAPAAASAASSETDDASLLVAQAEIHLRAGAADKGRPLLTRALETDPAISDTILKLGYFLCPDDAGAAVVCIDVVADQATAAGNWAGAAALFRTFVIAVPDCVPAALKLVELSVDGGLPGLHDAQVQLADACLAAGQGFEAKVIYEDLVAAFPADGSHVERRDRALSLLGLAAPEAPARAGGALSDSSVRGATATLTAVRPDARESEYEVDLAAMFSAEALAEPAAPIRRKPTDLPVVLPHGPGTQPRPIGSADPHHDDEAFRGFRDEVSRQRFEESAAQHYRLAVAYRDMGMTVEAIGALEVAARSTGHRFEAALVLGQLYRERGMYAAAIEWFERAAETPAPSVEKGRAVLYDSGELLVSAGEMERALAVFLEIQAEAGVYRDVAARIEELSTTAGG